MRSTKPPGRERLHDGRVPNRILDALADVGWMTVAGLALEVGANENTVHRALWRLRYRGLVRHRPGHGGRGGWPSQWHRA